MHKVEYYIVLFLFGLFTRISFKAGKRVALVIYFIVAKVLKYRRDVILQNLQRVYGDTLPMQEGVLLREIYKNFVYLWMEFLQTEKLVQDDPALHFTFSQQDEIKRVIDEGKGFILLSGHFGNFEWLGQFIAMLGYPVSGIAKRQSNPYVNDLVERNRKRNNIKVIYTKNAVNTAIETLAANEIVAIVADQDAGKRGLFVDFLGIPSSTAVGPAVIHLRSGAPVYLLISIRRDYGKFDVYLEKIYEGQKKPTNDELVKEITQLHADALAKWVRKHPDQWFWVHRRWKTKPEMKEEQD